MKVPNVYPSFFIHHVLMSSKQKHVLMSSCLQNKKHVLMSSCLQNKNMSSCSHVFKTKNMFSCSHVFKTKTCSLVLMSSKQKTCSHVLMSSKQKHVLLFSCLQNNMFSCPHVFKKNMISCLTDACVVRFGDRTSYTSLNIWIFLSLTSLTSPRPHNFPNICTFV